jgi:hypothetical protein
MVLSTQKIESKRSRLTCRSRIEAKSIDIERRSILMSKVKLMLVAVFAALALSAVAAGTASAQWLINGAALGAGKSAALESLVPVHGIIALKAPTLGIKIGCSGQLHITNGRILEPDLAFVEHIVFLNCNTVAPTPTKCKLETANETISTVAVLTLVTLGSVSPAVRLAFKPATGKKFAGIKFALETACVFEGEQPVSGSVTVNAPTGQNSNVIQAVQPLGSVENNSLEIGVGNKAILEEGTVLLCYPSTHPRTQPSPTHVIYFQRVDCWVTSTCRRLSSYRSCDRQLSSTSS